MGPSAPVYFLWADPRSVNRAQKKLLPITFCFTLELPLVPNAEKELSVHILWPRSVCKSSTKSYLCVNCSLSEIPNTKRGTAFFLLHIFGGKHNHALQWSRGRDQGKVNSFRLSWPVLCLCLCLWLCQLLVKFSWVINLCRSWVALPSAYVCYRHTLSLGDWFVSF